MSMYFLPQFITGVINSMYLYASNSLVVPNQTSQRESACVCVCVCVTVCVHISERVRVCVCVCHCRVLASRPPNFRGVALLTQWEQVALAAYKLSHAAT